MRFQRRSEAVTKAEVRLLVLTGGRRGSCENGVSLYTSLPQAAGHASSSAALPYGFLTMEKGHEATQLLCEPPPALTLCVILQVSLAKDSTRE